MPCALAALVTRCIYLTWSGLRECVGSLEALMSPVGMPLLLYIMLLLDRPLLWPVGVRLSLQV